MTRPPASPDTPSSNAPSPDTPSPDTPSPDTPSPDTPSPDTPSPDTPSSDTLFPGVSRSGASAGVSCVGVSPADPAGASREAVAGVLRRAGCVFAEEEADLLIEAAAGPGELAALVERRAAGLPLEQVVGWAGFHGLRIAVEPGVFVPRRRTEFLADQAIALTRPGAVVLDLCCGSGALGAAIAAAAGPVRLHAADIDPGAVRCARRNLAPAGAVVHQGDLYAALPDRLRGRIDVLVANTPYVPTAQIALLPAEARDHEPRAALDGGPDGLAVQRRVAAEAPRWLAPGGSLLVEAGDHQLPAAVSAMEQAGLTTRVEYSEEWSAAVVIGTRPH